MRLFTGIALPPDILAHMAAAIDELKPLAALRWTAPANLHITTKFIGEWPESRLDELIRQLTFPHAPVPITVENLGFFPKIFWAGIRQTPELLSLAQVTEAALEKLGIPQEPRPYAPHLTLARAPTPSALHALRPHARAVHFGAFEAHHFHLYLSKSSTYTSLATFALK